MILSLTNAIEGTDATTQRYRDPKPCVPAHVRNGETGLDDEKRRKTAKTPWNLEKKKKKNTKKKTELPNKKKEK